MKHMTFRERRYRRAHLDCVRHITLDPKGPGVVRIHMIPPKDDTPSAPFPVSYTHLTLPTTIGV